MPIVKLNGLDLSVSFLLMGVAYEKDIGPIGVIKSNDVPNDVLKSASDEAT